MPLSRTPRLIRRTNRLLSKLTTGHVTAPDFENENQMTIETQISTDDLFAHLVVSRDDWIAARKALDEIARRKVYYNYDATRRDRDVT